MTPARLTRPNVGMRPTTPQSDAGPRSDPPVSEPSATGTLPAGQVEGARDERTRLPVVPLDALDQRLDQLHGRKLPRRDQGRQLGNREVVELSRHGLKSIAQNAPLD